MVYLSHHSYLYIEHQPFKALLSLSVMILNGFNKIFFFFFWFTQFQHTISIDDLKILYMENHYTVQWNKKKFFYFLSHNL